ncbi:MAG: uridine phosphorylase [Anaerolineae bacterium]|jgi:uridine phosphorylase|nr:uridine phosphorylase [Anaerolineae bacterium]PKO02475.1 MAG: uridine phosphorylase [Chloroflexi bacterium HGW-Chloroflexi-5]
MRNEEGLAFHLHIKEGDVGRYVLLPGDPGRCEKIAQYFDNPHFVAHNREYVTWTGTLLGEKVSVVSTGIGCPSAAIAVEELVDVGADTFVRVGSSGSMQANVHMGDIVVVTASIRDEGTTSHYLPVEFPAVANVDVVNAMQASAKALGLHHHCGVSQSKDSFYGEVERTRMPMSAHLEERWNAWVSGGALCSEMESSAIFVLSSIYRKRAGGVMLVINESELAEETGADKHMQEFDAESVIKVAIEGIKNLIRADLNK